MKSGTAIFCGLVAVPMLIFGAGYWAYDSFARMMSEAGLAAVGYFFLGVLFALSALVGVALQVAAYRALDHSR